MLKLSAPLVWDLLLFLVWGGVAGPESYTREDKWWSSTELSRDASLVIGVTVSPFPSFSLGRDDLSGRIQEQLAQTQP